MSTATIDRPPSAVRNGHADSAPRRTVLETVLYALAPIIPYLLPVGGLALIVYAGFLVAPPLGYALAGLACLVLDFQMRTPAG